MGKGKQCYEYRTCAREVAPVGETGRSALQATAIQCACRDEWGKKSG